MNSSAPAVKKTIIRPTSGFTALRLGELWNYRELLYFLVWRDVKVRYKQTVLGAAWAILQPVFLMLVFTVFIGKLVGPPDVNYKLFAYTGLVPWTFFAFGLTQSSNSLIENANLVKKVYFPRLVVPIASVLGGIVDFALAFTVLLGMLAYYQVMPTMNVLWLPAFLLLALVTALGVGLWLSALNIKYRDVRYAIPFLAQFWMFATPVIYPSDRVPEFWRPFYGLNPMVGVVEGFRWALLGMDAAPGPMIAVSSLAAVVILIGGAFYFRSMERTFADVA